ncbi:PDZ domain-containing protein [Novipirellula artificiosorum]|uniref:PDZ domain-containing protein n=1 Tax=Novipirellula artificiosorum TaxID=2528016 RepID=A0A5C6CN67_9BACT|nr:PDZ domain-containing protein [Novipirellula artificiosorum]TWU24801.1 hypothetical protein Poly41_70790 [Novipirellula artificiosorum]
MKTTAILTALFAALMTLSTATAQNRVQVVPTPMPIAPPGQPAAVYFLGVYTSTVMLPGSGGGGPLGPVAMVQPRIMPVPGPGPQPQYGQRIDSVVPGSPAAAVGLERGDILVTANHVPLTCKGELSRAINSSGGQLHLTVINVRTGQPQHLTAYPRYQGGPVAYGNR